MARKEAQSARWALSLFALKHFIFLTVRLRATRHLQRVVYPVSSFTREAEPVVAHSDSIYAPTLPHEWRHIHH